MQFNEETKVLEVVLEQLSIDMGDKKGTLGPYKIPYIQVNLKWGIGWHVEIKTIKFLVDNKGEYLFNLGIGKDFLGRPYSY